MGCTGPNHCTKYRFLLMSIVCPLWAIIWQLSHKTAFACLQEMLRQAETRLQAAASSVKLPPWPSAATAACMPAELLLARRFGKLCRLLASLAAFLECLPSRSLQAMALQRIIPQVTQALRLQLIAGVE